MIILKKFSFLSVIVIANILLLIDPALAHRFNVVLVVPFSKAASLQGQQIQEGFMLATTERDGHPDQESDGHLGGLDVYVSAIDSQQDVAVELGRIVTDDEVDIVAVFGSESLRSIIKKFLIGKNIALLLPGQSPFAESELPAVAAFISAYERKYGHCPSKHAAQGYNAARRIDVAIRVQGGIDDKKSLIKSIRKSAHGFTW